MAYNAEFEGESALMYRRRYYYTALTICSLIYISGTLIAPISSNRFNLTPAKTHLLQVCIALPIILIWLAALYGAERLKTYSEVIKNYPDGKAMGTLAAGLTILVASIVINGLVSILRPWALRDGWLPAFTIINNYLSIIIPLIGFWIMYRGSTQLLKTTKVVRKYTARWIPISIVLAAIAAVYLLVIMNYDYRNATPDPTKYSSFYLPDWLIVISLVIPYLVAWGLGIKAALNVAAYRQEVKGTIYKNALKWLVAGVLLVVAFAVSLQLLIAFSTYFSKAGLAAILAIVYLIIIFYAVGYLVIASGARKLNAIEKVK
jgi:hypothetical protein